MLKTGLSST